MQNIIMSNKESSRVSILEQLNNKMISQQTAAVCLNLSVRQTRRVFRAYQKLGVAGLTHAGRGKSSNRKLDQLEVDRAIGLVRDHYSDFGPTFALEKLTEHHGVKFGVDTLRTAMMTAGLWKSHQKRHIKHHPSRERRPCEGELIQLDGSPYRWLEDRGNTGMFNLLVATDDATSKLQHLLFVAHESIESYFDFVKGYLATTGKPLAWYSDKLSVFRKSSKQGEGTQEDSLGFTQFGRAMNQLGINMIFANSPQAKGRVERANATLQRRLTRELRLRQINTIEAANAYLPEFITDYNRRFGVVPKNPINIHQPLSQDELSSLKDILVIKNNRVISKNLTVQYNNLEYQIQAERSGYALRKAKIEVWQDLQGEVRLIYKGKQLNYTIFKRQPKAEIVSSKHLNHVVDTLKRQHQSYFDKVTEHTWDNYHSAV